jgi:hypothetical protein
LFQRTKDFTIFITLVIEEKEIMLVHVCLELYCMIFLKSVFYLKIYYNKYFLDFFFVFDIDALKALKTLKKYHIDFF